MQRCEGERFGDGRIGIFGGQSEEAGGGGELTFDGGLGGIAKEELALIGARTRLGSFADGAADQVDEAIHLIPSLCAESPQDRMGDPVPHRFRVHVGEELERCGEPLSFSAPAIFSVLCEKFAINRYDCSCWLTLQISGSRGGQLMKN